MKHDYELKLHIPPYSTKMSTFFFLIISNTFNQLQNINFIILLLALFYKSKTPLILTCLKEDVLQKQNRPKSQE